MESLEGRNILESGREKPRYDGAVVHLYWLSDPKSDPSQPQKAILSSKSRVAAQAAALLDKNEGVGQFVLAVGQVWGEEYPSVAELAKQEMIQAGVDGSKIVIDKGLDTNDEVTAYRTHASDWKNPVAVAFEPHLGTLADVYRLGGVILPEIRTVEEIVSKYGRESQKKLIQKLTERYLLGHRIYELLKKIAIKAGIAGKMYQKSKERERYKQHVPGTDLLPIDHYHLDPKKIK